MLSEISKATNLDEVDITSVLITGPNHAIAEMGMSIDEYEQAVGGNIPRHLNQSNRNG